MKFNVVVDSQRPAFPGKHFHDHVFDVRVFSMADRILKGYNGGSWDYVETDTNVAFMRLADDGEGKQTLINPFSGEEITADQNLAGMIITSYAMLYQVEHGNNRLAQKLIDLNSAISDYCNETKQMDVWWAIMD